MTLIAGQHKTVKTTDATGLNVGSKTYGYCLRTDGTNAAKVEFRAGDETGDILWTDECVAVDLSKPHSFKLPMGRKNGALLHAVVTGTGAECDIQFD